MVTGNFFAQTYPQAVTFNGKLYYIEEGSYTEETAPYFSPEQRRTGRPAYPDTVYEQTVEIKSLHRGFGQARMRNDEDYESRWDYPGNMGLDTSYRGFIMLRAMGFDAQTPGSQVNAFAEFTPSIGAPQFAGSNFIMADNSRVRVYQGRGSGWTVVANAMATAASSIAIYDRVNGGTTEATAYIATSGGTLYRWDGAAAGLAADATGAYWIIVVGRTLWRVYRDASLGWAASKSADGNTWSTGYRIGDGAHAINWVWTYMDRLFFSTEIGIHSIDDAGVHEDLLPELRLQRDTLNGVGASVANDIAYIPTRGGTYEWQGANSPLVLARLGSMDSQVDSQRLRGRIHHLVPLGTQAAIGFLSDDATANNHWLIVRRRWPDALDPGLGYCPLMRLSQASELGNSVTPTAIFVRPGPITGLASVFVGGSDGVVVEYPMPVQQIPFQMTTPTATTWGFYGSGTVNLPAFDAELPTVNKVFTEIEMLVDIPVGTIITIVPTVDGAVLNSINWSNAGTNVIVKARLPEGTVGKQIQLALWMSGNDATASQALDSTLYSTATPLIKKIVLHYKLRPPAYSQWGVTILGNVGFPQWNFQSATFNVSIFRAQAGAGIAVPFIDPWGRQWKAWVEKVKLSNLAKVGGEAPAWGIQLVLVQDISYTRPTTTIQDQLKAWTHAELEALGISHDEIEVVF